MTSYTVTVRWDRDEKPFLERRYSRRHTWLFDGGAKVPASSSPHVVPTPMSDPAAVDPEEAFVAAISSCHMLWFLSIAARRGFTVNRYEDRAEGEMGTNDRGRTAMLRVTLHPEVVYDGGAPDASDEAAMHEEAHEKCFIANSVRTEIVVEP